MITPHLYPQRALKLPVFGDLLRSRELSDNGLRLEISFLNRSNHLLYKLQQGLKRALDFVLATLGLLAISPLLLLIAAAVKITSPGPVLYKSLRIGKNYKPFHMYKFRTMCVDADAKRDALRAQANLQGELFKLENDPRITGIGKLLRALSLDELPQLLNVVRGEMSLVGPRPLPPDESELFEDPYTLRFQVYPGITGLWQVSGRNDTTYRTRVAMDCVYAARRNALMDFGILFATVPAVLLRRGSY